MSQTIEARQKNPEETENMANLETPHNDVYGYLSREVADTLGEYLTLTVSDGEGVVTLVPQKETKNFGVYETPSGAIVGMGIDKSVLADVFDYDREEDDIPQEVGLSIDASTEDDYEQAESAEEEIDALLAGASGGSDEAEDEAEADDEEEVVEIDDEELDLIEG